MRYMFLIYSVEAEAAPEAMQAVSLRHRALMEETARLGVLCAADPLKPVATATTVRTRNGKPFTTDGPFAETKELLAGYYILECRDLDEAIEWARRIPTACYGAEGCIEIRPIHEIRP